jgi:hypothetical protein
MEVANLDHAIAKLSGLACTICLSATKGVIN